VGAHYPDRFTWVSQLTVFGERFPVNNAETGVLQQYLLNTQTTTNIMISITFC